MHFFYRYILNLTDALYNSIKEVTDVKIKQIDSSSNAFRFKKPRKAFTPYDFASILHDKEQKLQGETFTRRLKNEKDNRCEPEMK